MNLSEFPILASNLSYKGKDDARLRTMVEKALEILTTALNDGAVSNVGFKELKDYLNRAFERAWNNTVSEIYLSRPCDNRREGTDFEHDLYYTHPACHTAVGLLKKIEKSKETSGMIEAARALLQEIIPLAIGVTSLKDKVVKRQPKAAEDIKARFSPEKVRGTALEKIKTILEQVCEENYNALVEMFVDRQNHYLKFFIESGEKDPYTLFIGNPQKNGKRGDQFAYQVVSSVTVQNARRINEAVTLLPPAEIDHKFADKAIRDAKEIRDGFIYKNLNKLASIVDKKGDFAKIEVVGQNIDLNGLQGTLRLTFLSGAEFTVTNSVVFVRNSFWTEFYRFPLTFKWVKLSDGSLMKGPSEEKMNDATLFF